MRERPWPKKSFQSRFTKTRAVSGFSREVSQRARSRRVARASAGVERRQEVRDGGRHDLARVVLPVAARQDAHRRGLRGRRSRTRCGTVADEAPPSRARPRAGAARASASSGRRAAVEVRRPPLCCAALRSASGTASDLEDAAVAARAPAPCAPAARRSWRARRKRPSVRRCAGVLVEHERERRLPARAERLRELDHQAMALAVGGREAPSRRRRCGRRWRPSAESPPPSGVDALALRSASGAPARVLHLHLGHDEVAVRRRGRARPRGSSSNVTASRRSAVMPCELRLEPDGVGVASAASARRRSRR